MTEIPVLKIGDVLLVSIQTELNDRVAAILQQSILERIQDSHAPALLIDISSLDLVDSYIGRVLAETGRMARLMNSDVCLVGMKPAVALTMTEMGLSFPEIGTAPDIELGLEALGYRLERIAGDEVATEADVSALPAEDASDARS